MAELSWIDDVTCQIDDVTFVCTFPTNVVSRPNRFAVLKGKADIQRYLDLFDEHRPKRILEIGAWSGGSAAMLSLLVAPDRMAVVDLHPDPAPALDRFVEMRGLAESIHRYWGTDQSDTAALEKIISTSFGDDPIDLMIDDASHILGPTRVSFDHTFPRLRPGGVFVLEDWSHEHNAEMALLEGMKTNPEAAALVEQAIAGGATETSPLSILVVELVLAATCRPDVISDLQINRGWAKVTRGPADLSVGDFELAACTGRRGRTMIDTLDGIWPSA